MSKPKGACTHEPAMSAADAIASDYIRDEMLIGGAVKIGRVPGGGVKWYCAKCRRYLRARWYPTEAKL